MSGVRLVWHARGPRSARSRFVWGSLTVHVVVAILLVSLPALRGSDRLPVDAVAVQLVAAPPAPLPAVRAAAPPPAEVPKPTVPAPAEVPKEPKAKPKPKPKPTPVKPPPETAKVEAEPAETTGSGATPSAPDLAAPASSSGGAAIEALDLGSDEFAWYRASVTASLHAHWSKPILDGLTEASEVVVAFEIERNGSVRDLRIERSSGVPMLDRSALRAVGEAAPLPPLPKTWSSESLPATFVFRLLPE